MAERRDPWTPLEPHLQRSAYIAQMEAMTDWSAMARRHCAKRADCVAELMLFLQEMRRTGRIPPAPALGFVAAHRQMTLPARAAMTAPPRISTLMEDAGITGAGRERILKKAFTTQDAHCMPCQVTVGATLLQTHLDAGQDLLARARLEALFGVVQRMPTMFNESDTQAESRGFIPALRAGTARLTTALAPTAVAGPADLEDAYGVFLSEARQGLGAAIEANQTLYGAAGDAAERFYRRMKIEMLSAYRDALDTERPELLRKPQLVGLFRAMWD
ncbi:MAG: hypothetical protein AAF318_00425 [Pseudomonadota bacterium]